MASPEGISAEAESSTDILSDVSDGESYSERASAAYKALESGADPKDVNEAYNTPRKQSAADGKAEDKSDTADDQPEEATDDGADGDPKTESKAKKADEDSEDSPERREQLLIAKRILSRDNLTEDDLKLFSEERILELAEKRSKVHQSIDERFFQAKKPESGNENTDTTSNAETTDEETIELIRDFDDELAEKVKAEIDGHVSKMAELERELALVKFQGVVQNKKSEFPELKDQSVLNRVLDKAGQLAQSQAYDTAESAMDDACQIVLGGRREQSAQENLLKSGRKQLDGQIDTDTVADNERRPMTRSEKESYGFMLLSEGLSAKEVSARLAKIPES